MWCLQVAFVSSYMIFDVLKGSQTTPLSIHIRALCIRLRNMIQTSGVRQLHYGNLHKIAAFSFSTKKCDAYKWH